MLVILGRIETKVQKAVNNAFVSCACEKKVLKKKVWLTIIGAALCLGLFL